MFSSRWTATVLLLGAALSGWLRASPSNPIAEDRLARQLQAAEGHYNSGQYQIAARELASIAQRVPANFEVEELLGLVYSAETRNQQARPHFERAVHLRPSFAPARLNLAVCLANLGENTLAEMEFKKAIQAEPGNFDANHDLGELFARGGKVKAAIPYLEKAQRVNPSSYGNGYDLALAYTHAGMLPEAQLQIQALLSKKNTAALHELLAEVEEKSGSCLAAVNEYQQAAHMDPSESNIYYWGSELLLHQTWNPAIQVFSEGLKRYPNSLRLAVGLGLALYWRESYDDAVKVLVRATELAPSDPRPYYFLNETYEHSPSQAAEVIEQFRRFARLRPQDGRAVYYYAMSLWKGKQAAASAPNLDRVESLLKRATHLDPSFAKAYFELGNLFSQRGQYRQAALEYQRALKLDGKLVAAYYRVGQAYVHLGEMGLARKEFQIHKKLYQQHLAKWDKEDEEIRKFVYTTRAQGSVAR